MSGCSGMQRGAARCGLYDYATRAGLLAQRMLYRRWRPRCPKRQGAVPGPAPSPDAISGSTLRSENGLRQALRLSAKFGWLPTVVLMLRLAPNHPRRGIYEPWRHDRVGDVTGVS